MASYSNNDDEIFAASTYADHEGNNNDNKRNGTSRFAHGATTTSNGGGSRKNGSGRQCCRVVHFGKNQKCSADATLQLPVGADGDRRAASFCSRACWEQFHLDDASAYASASAKNQYPPFWYPPHLKTAARSWARNKLVMRTTHEHLV